ncbi:hypothetical protein Agub_g3047, partial [Astrephomene gubernaculifera]
MEDREDDGTGSQRSGATGSESEHGRRSDLKFLSQSKRGPTDEAEEGDLLEQKRTVQDGVFACMYTLVRQTVFNSWKFAVLKLALEFLIFFLMAFNPGFPQWKIRTSNPAWQLVRWVLWRGPVAHILGYRAFIGIMYGMAASVFLSVGGLAWLTLAMRQAEQSKWMRTAAAYLHVVYDIMFVMAYPSFLDYFAFVANCDFTGPVKRHNMFTDVMCLELPHLLHMCVALLTGAVFLCVVALMLVACGELNPISRHLLASPAVHPRLRALAAKAVFIVSCADLGGRGKLQAVVNVVAAGAVCWFNLRALPFYSRLTNAVWTGQWVGILYTCLVRVVLVYGKDQSYTYLRSRTLYVLYGLLPVTAASMGLVSLYSRWDSRPARKFRELPPGAVKLTRVHRFADVYQVERLARAMRLFDSDGWVEEGAAEWGETVLRAGMQAFPGRPFLLILHANFLLHVRRDGPAARTQLQLAARHSPSLVERYQVFCTDEASKRLQDGKAGGMDLQAYIEFRRNYSAVIRVHKAALLLQTQLWRLLLRPSLRVGLLDAAMDEVEAATARAHQVYKRVLERYPNNGKLLRCYGKFLEDVRHDPAAAARAYGEASRNGGGDALLSLDLSGVQGADKPEILTAMSLQEDAVIVCNAEGTIMMTSQAVQPLFGYSKSELEGANVSLLMPPPFSTRHAAYLQRYTASGQPHILDSMREVIALHKDHHVFPIALCVTKLSGTGADSIFLGVVRPLSPSPYNMRAWLAPNGTFLCSDQLFASMVGLTEGELVGRSLPSLVPPESAPAVEAYLERCRAASALELIEGRIQLATQLTHRYSGGEPVSVEITTGMAGTDQVRILVLNTHRTDGREDCLLVVEGQG